MTMVNGIFLGLFPLAWSILARDSVEIVQVQFAEEFSSRPGKACANASGFYADSVAALGIIVTQSGCNIEFAAYGSSFAATVNGQKFTVSGWAEGKILSNGDVHFADGNSWKKQEWKRSQPKPEVASINPDVLLAPEEAAANQPRSAGCRSFAHVVSVMPFDDLRQNLTLESMLQAEGHARDAGVRVSLYLVFLDGEEHLVPIPEGFSMLPVLGRSFNTDDGKRLPFLKDILSELKQGSSDDCLIYSNVDIGVTRSFYTEVRSIFESGVVEVLNVHKTVLDASVLADAHCLPGKSCEMLGNLLDITRSRKPNHAGDDCFVFRRPVLDQVLVRIADVILGFPPIGCELAEGFGDAVPKQEARALICGAPGEPTNSPGFSTCKHGSHALTFHVGESGDHTTWKGSDWGKGNPVIQALVRTSNYCNDGRRRTAPGVFTRPLGTSR